MKIYIAKTIALIASAIVFVCCSSKKTDTADTTNDKDVLTMEFVPVDMLVSQEGVPRQVVKGGLGQQFENKAKKNKYMIFPKGIRVESYADSDTSLLESTITANFARIDNQGSKNELYYAYGNVVVENLLKHQRIETDTIYWDRNKHQIYNNCYSKFFIENGYFDAWHGFISDEKVTNYELRTIRDGDIALTKRKTSDTTNTDSAKINIEKPQ